MEKSTVGERFVQLISHLGISKNAFAASLDKTATVIQHLVDERNKPGFDLLCKVFEVYPNVSKEWLLQGTGPMLSQQEPTAVEPQVAGKSQLPGELTAEVTSPVLEQKRPAESPAAMKEASVSTSTRISAPAPELPAAPLPVAATQPQSVAAPLEPDAPAPVAAVAPAPAAPAAADASWQTALYTQQMAHQLALAELRNQHLQEQQRLMQQMMDLMQRQLTR